MEPEAPGPVQRAAHAPRARRRRGRRRPRSSARAAADPRRPRRRARARAARSRRSASAPARSTRPRCGQRAVRRQPRSLGVCGGFSTRAGAARAAGRPRARVRREPQPVDDDAREPARRHAGRPVRRRPRGDRLITPSHRLAATPPRPPTRCRGARARGHRSRRRWGELDALLPRRGLRRAARRRPIDPRRSWSSSTARSRPSAPSPTTAALPLVPDRLPARARRRLVRARPGFQSVGSLAARSGQRAHPRPPGARALGDGGAMMSLASSTRSPPSAAVLVRSSTRRLRAIHHFPLLPQMSSSHQLRRLARPPPPPPQLTTPPHLHLTPSLTHQPPLPK